MRFIKQSSNVRNIANIINDAINDAIEGGGVDNNADNNVDNDVGDNADTIDTPFHLISAPTLNKLCGEMLNIELGRDCYIDGVLCNEGDTFTRVINTHTYTFRPIKGEIYTPSEWSQKQNEEFARMIEDNLKNFPIDHIGNITSSNDASIHTMVMTKLQPMRGFTVANKSTVQPHNYFMWVIKPMYMMLERDINVDTVVDDYASLVYDMYDLWNIDDCGKIINPTYDNLRIAGSILSHTAIKMTHFKHGLYQCRFFHLYKPDEIVERKDLTGITYKEFPTSIHKVIGGVGVYGDGGVGDGSVSAGATITDRCTQCKNPTYDRVYLAKARTKFIVYCPNCIHDSRWGINAHYTSMSPNTMETAMKEFGIPNHQQRVYLRTTMCEKNNIVQNGVVWNNWKLGDNITGINGDRFSEFATSAVSREITGDIVSVVVIVIK
jgi:hypothetical protein